MIKLKNIHKSYEQHKVLKGIDITFKAGEISMLLGASGCGKSTMLKLINRLIEPDSGEIWIDGKLARDFQPELLRRQIGYAIQGVGLFPHLSVRDNIAVVPKLLRWDKKRINERVDELMTLMEIPESYGLKKPSMLSGGEAQRIGVARALGANPDILLMDEPFGALDPITRDRLQQEFLDLQQKLHKTVVFVTHDVGEAVRMADQLVLIHEGQIISANTPESLAICEDDLVRSFFGDQLALELLHKYTPNHYPHLFLKHEAEGGYNLNIIESEYSFREMITYMLEHSTSEVGVHVGGKVYKVSFDDLVAAFGGGQIVK